MYAFASDATFDFSSLPVSERKAAPEAEQSQEPISAKTSRRGLPGATLPAFLVAYALVACLMSSAMAWAGTTRSADGKPYVASLENMLFDPETWRLRPTLPE